MSLRLNNIFELLPKELDAEVFEDILQNDNIKVQRIVSKGQASPTSDWYDQDKDEWVIVLQGEAIIIEEDGSEHHLVAGSYLNIPAHSRHRVKWTMPDIETIWLAIHY